MCYVIDAWQIGQREVVQGVQVLSAHVIPILLGFLVSLLISLVVVGLMRSQSQPADDSPTRARDDLLLQLLVLAAFISGVFLTYVFLKSGF